LVPVLTLVVIAFVAWRYRRVLGLGKRWHDFDRDRAVDRATRLGWSSRGQTAGDPTRRPVPHNGASRGPQPGFLPSYNSRYLPAALAAGVVESAIVLGLDLAGHDVLSLMTGLLLGPFVGGLIVRSLWWPLVAALVAVVVGAGELGTSVIALPVAAIGYAGVRADFAAWLARLNADADDSPS
jgi:hypothetical protein